MSDDFDISALKALVEATIQETADHAEWLMDFAHSLRLVEISSSTDVSHTVVKWKEMERRDEEANEAAGKARRALKSIELVEQDITDLDTRFNFALMAVIIAHTRIRPQALRIKAELERHMKK